MNTLEFFAQGRIALRGGGILRVEIVDGDAERIVLSGLGSQGPVQLAPTSQPERVARLLVRLGLVRTEAKAA